jgi:APA family basic amino acid/polyamine antiporter
MKRALGPIELIALGIGAIVGAGIFAVIGSAAARSAPRRGRPGLVISILITAMAAVSARWLRRVRFLPSRSSGAYTYSYATLGEFVPGIIGWDLIIESRCASSPSRFHGPATSASCSRASATLPARATTISATALKTEGFMNSAPHLFGIPIVVNIPAAAITCC